MIDFPKDIKDALVPTYTGHVVYECIGCGAHHPIQKFLYTCPSCGSLLSLRDLAFDQLTRLGGDYWRKLFAWRALAREPRSLKGIFRFHELILPCVPPEDVIWLGEGHTPLVPVNDDLARIVGAPFLIKYDGLNPSASFKDRGMASAISYLNHALRHWHSGTSWGSAPRPATPRPRPPSTCRTCRRGGSRRWSCCRPGKVTPQQLSQPLGSGARVIEVPGVFDDCMKLVEELSRDYDVFLLNSKNPVRINGQKSYAYEVAMENGWRTRDLAVVVPIGNAGNVTAIMEGFLDLLRLGVIDALPMVVGVQSLTPTRSTAGASGASTSRWRSPPAPPRRP